MHAHIHRQVSFAQSPEVPMFPELRCQTFRLSDSNNQQLLGINKLLDHPPHILQCHLVEKFVAQRSEVAAVPGRT
jgi:hypothetical protein